MSFLLLIYANNLIYYGIFFWKEDLLSHEKSTKTKLMYKRQSKEKK